jgi:hypothetical protein
MSLIFNGENSKGMPATPVDVEAEDRFFSVRIKIPPVAACRRPTALFCKYLRNAAFQEDFSHLASNTSQGPVPRKFWSHETFERCEGKPNLAGAF